MGVRKRGCGVVGGVAGERKVRDKRLKNGIG